MHDYHAVEALVGRLASGVIGTERIVEVRIRAGATFSPEALQQAYEVITLGTPLEGSRLVVEPGQDERESSA